MIPLTARQAERFGDVRLSPETLVELTTYTDRSLKTVDQVFYFSTSGVYYQWGGADRFFEPMLDGVAPMRAAITHIPQLEPTRDSLRRRTSISLTNAEDENGAYLLTRLRQHTLEFATVVVAELPLDRSEPKERGFDLRHLAGDEHLVRFRGRVRRVEVPTAEQITISVVSDIPELARFPVFTSEVDQRHFGVSVPWVVGALVENVPGINARAPQESEYGVLRSNIDAAALAANIFVPKEFRDQWADSGTIRIEDEQISYSSFAYDGATEIGAFIFSARGVNGTTAAEHELGELVSRQPSPDTQIAAVFAKSPVSLIDRLSVRNANDEFPREIEASFIPDLALQTFNAEDLGFTAAGVLFDLDAVNDLVTALARAAQVTQQPQVGASPTASTSEYFWSASSDANRAVRDKSTATRGDWTTSPSPNWTRNDGTGDKNQLVATYFRALTPIPPYGNPADNYVVSMRIQCLGVQFSTDLREQQKYVQLSVKARNFDALTNATVVQRVGEDTWFPEDTAPTGPHSVTRDLIGEPITPSSNTLTLQDLIDGGAKIKLWANSEIRDPLPAPTPQIDLTGGNWGVLLVLAAANQVLPLLADVEIFARGDRIDYSFFADVRGPVAPDASYVQPAGELIQQPPDVFRYFIREVLGEPATAIDSVTWTQAEADLSGTLLNVISSDYGDTFEAVAAGMGHDCYAQLVTFERNDEMKWALLTSDASGAYPATVATIDEWEDFSEEGRDADSIFTAFRAFYRPNRALRFSDTGWTQAFEGSSDRSDFAVDPVDFSALNSQYGRWWSQSRTFLGVTDAVTLDAIFGRYVREESRAGAVYAMTKVPWVQHAALEIGDTVDLTPPWESTPRKCRILEIVRRFDDGLADLRAVGVL